MPEERSGGWKTALSEYVNLVNEAGVRGDPSLLEQVPDLQHRRRLVRRLQSVLQREGAARIVPVRSEVRARLLRHSENASEAIADVELHLRRSSEQRGRPWLEERKEKERIRFVRSGSRWRVDRIEPLSVERGTGLLGDERAHGSAADGAPLPSVPYLNPDALLMLRVYAGEADGWQGGRRSRGTPYRREEAVAYADRWWDQPNPAYEEFDVNCTNYVSQCLLAGGAPMNYTGRRENGWWYKGRQGGRELWSYSWAVSNALQAYLSGTRTFGLRAQAVRGPEQLRLGDVICYDWDGEGRYQHTTVVTAFAPDGSPLVNANTVSSKHRYWDYRDSYAWTDATRYRFFHVADEF